MERGRLVMYLMYVDESGDTGLVNSPTRYFCLSGIVVHELRWQTTLAQLVIFRRRMRDIFGLLMREEIHVYFDEFKAEEQPTKPSPLPKPPNLIETEATMG